MKIGIIGSGDNACNALKIIHNYFGSGVLITRRNDQTLSIKTEGAKKAGESLGWKVYETEDFESAKSNLIYEKIDFLVLCGTSWILDDGFISQLSGRIVNFHPSRLPNHKGAGVFSWQILNQVESLTISAHWVTKKIDSGATLFEIESRNKSLKKISDFFDAYYDTFPHAVKNLAEILVRNPACSPVSNSGASDDFNKLDGEDNYYPLLSTPTNGAIDWTWTLNEIDLFLNAFGPPYSGAFSFFQGVKFGIVEWRPIACNTMHPYFSGLISMINNEGAVKIICNGGVLEISKINIYKDNKIQASKPSLLFTLGGRVWTPSDILDQAREYRPQPN